MKNVIKADTFIYGENMTVHGNKSISLGMRNNDFWEHMYPRLLGTIMICNHTFD